MRKIYITLLIAILCGGCTSRRPADGEPLYVSILPLRSLVQGIVGDDFDIEVLVPPGASPETFEPTPRQFVGLNKARMVFNVGLIDFETMLLAKIEDQAKVVNLSRGIELIAGTCSHGSHGHTHTHGIDPHVWTSPRALQKMAENAYEAIREAYPDSVKYETNYRLLQQELKALDERTAARIAARPHLLRPGLRVTADCHRSRREGTVGKTTDTAYPAGTRRRRAAHPLPEPVPGIGRGGHCPRHRRRVCGGRPAA